MPRSRREVLCLVSPFASSPVGRAGIFPHVARRRSCLSLRKLQDGLIFGRSRFESQSSSRRIALLVLRRMRPRRAPRVSTHQDASSAKHVGAADANSSFAAIDARYRGPHADVALGRGSPSGVGGNGKLRGSSVPARGRCRCRKCYRDRLSRRHQRSPLASRLGVVESVMSRVVRSYAVSAAGVSLIDSIMRSRSHHRLNPALLRLFPPRVVRYKAREKARTGHGGRQ